MLAVNPLTERVIWIDDQDPISHDREVRFCGYKGCSYEKDEIKLFSA